MRSLLGTSESEVQSWPKFGAMSSQGAEFDPCLAWVRREQKAAAKEAKFGAHFTQIVRYSVHSM